ncbi:MAG: response regulator, partial [Phycisphaerales bacterium]|nr:response regulator [Phycisphaerales bacterium]
VFLSKHGYCPICVEDGYQALDFAIRERPDLLLLDVHMPAGDGFGVHERVVKHPELTAKPVIFMTHDPSPEVERIAEEHGAIALMHKPFDLVDLLAKIKSALDHGVAEAA